MGWSIVHCRSTKALLYKDNLSTETTCNYLVPRMAIIDGFAILFYIKLCTHQLRVYSVFLSIENTKLRMHTFGLRYSSIGINKGPIHLQGLEQTYSESVRSLVPESENLIFEPTIQNLLIIYKWLISIKCRL